MQNGQTLEYDQEESCTLVATLKRREVGPGNEATLVGSGLLVTLQIPHCELY